MGSRQPAVLLRETVNVETFGEERKERLSTGRYTLIDVSCRGCYKKLGWHYLAAVSPVSLSAPLSESGNLQLEYWSAYGNLEYPCAILLCTVRCLASYCLAACQTLWLKRSLP